MFFRLTLENCQVCNDVECSMDSLEIIQNACSDNLPLSSLMSMPVSMSADADVNRYIRTINSDYSYQLAEMTLFQFPNTSESKLKIIIIFLILKLNNWNESLVTVACDIALRPKQALDAYELRHISKNIKFFTLPILYCNLCNPFNLDLRCASLCGVKFVFQKKWREEEGGAEVRIERVAEIISNNLSRDR